MTQFNPINAKYKTSIVCTREFVYLIVANLKNKKTGRYLKNPKVLVGKVLKHRYDSAAPIVQVLEEWLDIIDLEDVFVKALRYPPETIWSYKDLIIDFSTQPESLVAEVFTFPMFQHLYSASEYLELEDELDNLL